MHDLQPAAHAGTPGSSVVRGITHASAKKHAAVRRRGLADRQIRAMVRGTSRRHLRQPPHATPDTKKSCTRCRRPITASSGRAASANSHPVERQKPQVQRHSASPARARPGTAPSAVPTPEIRGAARRRTRLRPRATGRVLPDSFAHPPLQDENRDLGREQAGCGRRQPRGRHRTTDRRMMDRTPGKLHRTEVEERVKVLLLVI